ncbi:MAG: SIR2 family protein [Roseobacter sp.]
MVREELHLVVTGPELNQPNTAIKVFLSYAHRDEEHKATFRAQLVDLVRKQEIDLWDDRELVAGDDWLPEIRERVETCDVAVLLVSSHFLESEFIYSEECGRLMARHTEGSVRIFPIILRPCRWKASVVSSLQVLPKDGKPVVSFSAENGEREQTWADVGDAFAAVISGLRNAQTSPAEPEPTAAPEPAPAPLKPKPSPYAEQFAAILRAMDMGRVAFFLGERVNRPDPNATTPWEPGNPAVPPLGSDIAQFIADSNAMALPEDLGLAEVAQRVAVREGIAPIYADLHQMLNIDYAITDVHRALARLPQTLRATGRKDHNPIIITVNYDDLVERAFAEEGEPLDVLAYSVDQNNRGVFKHVTHDGALHQLDRPNEYVGLVPGARPLLVKLAGTVDRTANGSEHFVVTEDDHFSYVVDRDIRQLLPPTLMTRLLRCHYLFLGHSLSHWTLRSIISRVFGRGRLPARSWVVGDTVDATEKDFWTFRNAESIEMPLSQFTSSLLDQVSGKDTAGTP